VRKCLRPARTANKPAAVALTSSFISSASRFWGNLAVQQGRFYGSNPAISGQTVAHRTARSGSATRTAPKNTAGRVSWWTADLALHPPDGNAPRRVLIVNGELAEVGLGSGTNFQWRRCGL
jgi:hypothetical protein